MPDKKTELGLLRTEQIDSKFQMLDVMTVSELLQAMNESDAEVPKAINLILPKIGKAIDAIIDRMLHGGRLIYIGAGTSGRLGILDAAECGPTFSVSTDQVLAFIAGGDNAIKNAVEGAEDKPELGAADLKSANVNQLDCVVGIAASGRTPYVMGAIDYARSVGALTIALTCNPDSQIGKHSDHALDIDSGPELLAGSTRLKSGTAQKLVLNMISTISMVRLGKTFGNLMVDLQINNEKLADRAVRIIEKATGSTKAEASEALLASGHEVKVAILMLLLNIDPTTARGRLHASSNRIREALTER
ncbi:MAG: N-acetylmuramic acid 6-phosphate etherase [Bacteroidota bacterium]|nr:N-acetylmuramic acid 6-phosphate etherase [Bacteroidota bacterium]